MALSKLLLSSLFFLLSLCLCVSLPAQTGNSGVQSLKPVPQQNRVAASPNFGPQAQLHTTLPNWANADRAIAGQPVDLTSLVHVSVVLQRDPVVQAAFEQLLADQQTPSSPMFHQWLTPQRVGELYGPTKDDIAAVMAWLGSQGLTVNLVAPSGMILEATGTAQSVGNAFRVSFANFTVGDKVRRGAMAQPSIPAVLVPVIGDVSGLNETIAEPQSHITGPVQISSGGVQPDYTVTVGSSYYISSVDFQTIYDIGSVISGGNTGAMIGNVNQHIAIIGRSRVMSATDIAQFATKMGLASYNLNTIIPTNGTDPGNVYNNDSSEAILDVDRVIGTANGAQADLVTSLTTGGTDGVYIAAAYNVNTLVDPVMTISFGLCEINGGSAYTHTWDTLFATGAAEGISTFVSSGDSAAAGCDAAFSNAPSTTQSLSQNQICSSSYVTCVGGTEFNDASSYSTYWNSSNGTGLSSAKSYIPEGAWNEPGTAAPYQIIGTGGGVSTVIAKPSWQTGTGVPADAFRDTPDVAFSGAGHDPYYFCYAANGFPCSAGYYYGEYGTSAAAPGMAGIAALLNTKMGVAQGNLNPLIYGLAASSPSVFHDVTVASSGVVSCSTATPSMCNNSTATLNSLTGGLAGYAVQTGYDQATGWGSLDVANFLTAASTPGATPQTITFPQPATGYAGGTATLTASSSPSGLGIIYTIASGPATIAGNKVTYTGTGSVTINATQPGNYQYAAAATVQKTVTVNTATATFGTMTFTPTTIGQGTSQLVFINDTITYTGAMPTGAVTYVLNGVTYTATCTNVGGSPMTCSYAVQPATVAALPLNSYTVTAALAADTYYSAASGTSGTFVVLPVPTFTWNPSSATGYVNVPIGSGVLDAGSPSTPGTFSYSATLFGGTNPVTASSLLSIANTYTLTATLTPTDTTHYASASQSVNFTVKNQGVFVALSGGSTASFYDGGTVQSSATGGGIGAAVDASGNVWSINTSGSTVSFFTNNGTFIFGFSGSGISSAKALAIDGNNHTWIANGNGTVTALTNNGVGIFTTPIDPAGGTAAPASISVDTAGSLWLSVPGSNNIIEVIGAAGPISTPTVKQVINSTPGSKPPLP